MNVQLLRSCVLVMGHSADAIEYHAQDTQNVLSSCLDQIRRCRLVTPVCCAVLPVAAVDMERSAADSGGQLRNAHCGRDPQNHAGG